MTDAVLTETPAHVHDFDRAIALDRTGRNAFEGRVQPGWDLGGHPNGGYLAAIALHAADSFADGARPVLVRATYLRPAVVGPIEVSVFPASRSRSHQHVQASLVQDEQVIAEVRTIFSSVVDERGSEYLSSTPPDLPDPEHCIHPHPGLDLPFPPPPITGRVELRLRPEHTGFSVGAPHGTAEIEGWLRFPDGRDADHLALPLFADAFPPAVFNAGLPLAWVPTLEMAVQQIHRPAPGWLRARFITRSVAGGYLEEDGELWDAEGRLVALSRQLAAAPLRSSATATT